MKIIQNVNVETERTSDKVAYATQARYDETNATITLFDGVKGSDSLIVNDDYLIDSKDLEDPVKAKYTGTAPPGDPAGNPIFLIL